MAITGSDPAQLSARLAVLRLGTGRLGAIWPITTKVTIGGTARQIDKAESRISLIDGEPWTATLRVRDFTPTLGQEVLIGIGDTAAGGRLFAGRIQRRTRLPKARTADVTLWDIECIDPTWELDKRFVLESYATVPVAQMVQDILTTYTSGFTLDTQGDLGTLAMDFTYERPSRCLTRICDAIGADWQVDPFKRVRLFLTDTKRPQPKPLDASCPYEFRQLGWSEDYSQIRTRAIVEGVATDVMATDAVLNRVTIDEDSLAWATVITDSSGLQGRVRTATANVAPAGAPPTYDPPGAGILTFSSPPNASVGDELSLFVTRDDSAAQTAVAALEGGTGVRENYFQDRRLTKIGAEARGDADLTLYAAPIETVTFLSRDPAFVPGVDVTVDIDGLSGTYRVRRVDLDTLEDTQARYPLRRVEASSVRQDFYDVLRRIERVGLRL